MQGSAGGVLAKLLWLISDLMARDADRYWHTSRAILWTMACPAASWRLQK
jgi:hypothetical protein